MSNAPYEDLKLRRQRAMEEAAAWLLRLQEDAPNSAVRSAYADWLRESPLHVAAMLRVSQTDGVLAAFDGWDEIPTESGPFKDNVVEWPVPLDGQGASVARPRALTPMRAMLSAAVALVVVFAIGGTLWWSGFVGGSAFRTTTGERRNVALQDGSTLVLGPETSVRVEFSGAERYVSLERGEALFKVAKDPGRPFIVAAEHARVRALGTEFGVEKREDGSIVVTVAEGRVAVTQNAPSVANASPVALMAGEQLAIPHAGTSSPVRKVDSAASLAWANGRLVFDNETIGFIVERFNQYNRVQLSVTDAHIASRRISGSFDASDPESFLTFLSASVPVTISRTHSGGEIAIEAGESK